MLNVSDKGWSQSESPQIKPSTPPKVAIINGIVAQYDAISAAVLDTYKALVQNKAFNVSIFCYRNDYPEVPSHAVSGVNDILLHRDYLDADIIIWHFGIYYELFNIIAVGNGSAQCIVCFHNVTPKEFVPKASWKLIDQSLNQCHLMKRADEVWAVSPVNAATCRDLHVPEHKIHTIPLVVETSTIKGFLEKSSDAVEILFVGRFVPSKGVIDLLQAVRGLRRQKISTPFVVRLVGNIDFSNANYVAEVRSFIECNDLKDVVIMHGTVEDQALLELYQTAHILAIPSYHEGFCKPVVEALRAGCIPVGYAAYNLPHVAAGFGRLVEPGDGAGLRDALQDVIEAVPRALQCPNAPELRLDMGEVSALRLQSDVAAYVQQFTAECVGSVMRGRLHALLDEKR